MRCLSAVIFNLSDEWVRAIYSLLDNILLYNNVKHLWFPVYALVEMWRNNYDTLCVYFLHTLIFHMSKFYCSEDVFSQLNTHFSVIFNVVLRCFS